MPDFDPSQIADHRSNWIASGLDPAVFDAAAASIAPRPAPVAPAAPAPTFVPHPVAPPDHAGDHATELARGLLANGTPLETVKAALRGDGYDDAAIALIVGPAAPQGSVDEREFAAALGGAQPTDYGALIPYTYASQLGEGLHAADGEWRTNLAAMGVSAAAGPGIVECALETFAALQGMSQDEKVAFADKSDADLIAVTGSREAAEAMAKQANAALAKADPGFAKAVRENGGLLDPRVIVALAMAADNVAVRDKLKAGQSLNQIAAAGRA